MNEMIVKKEFIGVLADFCHGSGIQMTGEDLAMELNRHGFLTSYGTPYEGKRGTYRLVDRAHQHFFFVLGDPGTAERIALVFISKSGRPAWDN